MGLRKRTADTVDGSFWDTGADVQEAQDWAGYLGLDEAAVPPVSTPTAEPDAPAPVQLTRPPTDRDGPDPYAALAPSIDDLLPRR